MWQVQVEGQVYESDFDQLTQWIMEGSVSRSHLVKRGSLRWLAAGKVPALIEFFNAAPDSTPQQPVVSTTDATEPNGEAVPSPTVVAENVENFEATVDPDVELIEVYEPREATSMLFCNFHKERFPDHICGTCNNLFCTECIEQSEVGCPVCGSDCQPFEPREEFAPVAADAGVADSSAQGSFTVIPDEVLSGANWFFWIAALTLINSIIILSGFDWAFVLGLALTQVFDVGAVLLAEAGGAEGVSIFHAIAFVMDLFVVGVFCTLGFFARRAAKWAFIVGMIFYGLDTFLTLLTFSFIGIGIHLFALYCIYKGYSNT